MIELKKIKKDATIKTEARYQSRNLIIELHRDRPGELKIREAGRQTHYWVDFESIFCVGAKQAAESARQEKLVARKVKRKGA